MKNIKTTNDDIKFYVDTSNIISYQINQNLTYSNSDIYHSIEQKNRLLREPHDISFNKNGVYGSTSIKHNFNKELQLKIDSEVVQILRRHTLLLCKTKKNKPEGVASAVYVTYKNKEYIFSVGHTFNQFNMDELYIYLKNAYISIKECDAVIFLPCMKENFKELDLMIIKVDRTKSKLINANGYCSFNLGDELPFYDTYGKYNICYGFPASYNDPSNYSKNWTGRALCLDLSFEHTFLQKKELSEINSKFNEINFVDSSLNPFKRRMMRTTHIGSNQTELIPNLYGMSGCGIWYFKNYPYCSNEYVLSGLFMGVYSNHNYIIIDKIKSILNILDEIMKNYTIKFERVKGVNFL